ncbi:uncharacterized protein VTP21DRAFT_2567 [Calcarisporiella thermophila]|uniref:uncharacterized protein n=1 Tax=Calcarisporiella thermophila TaxID=911321 RepID=UPI003743209C
MLLILAISQRNRNPYANPYSPAMVSTPYTSTRRGYGPPIPLDQYSLACAKDSPSPCSIAYTVQASTKGDAFTQKVADSIENSLSDSYSHTDSQSVTDNVSRTLTNGYQKSHATINTRGSETFYSKDSHWDQSANVYFRSGDYKEDSSWWNIDAKISGCLGASELMKAITNWKACAEVSSGYGESKFESHSRENGVEVSASSGGSSLYNFRGSESSTKSDSFTDTHTEAVENSHSINRGTSDTTTKTKTVTHGHTESFATTHNVQFSKSESHEDQKRGAWQRAVNNGTTFSQAQGYTVQYQFQVAPGKCKMLVALPYATIITVPFLCVSSEQLYEIRYTDIINLDIDLEKKFKSAIGVVNCGAERDDIDLPPFGNDMSELDTADSTNSIRFGDIFNSSSKLTSKSGEFSFYFEITGKLVLYQGSNTIWQNSIDYLTNYPVRARINEKGHFLIEAQNIFINHNYTIGVPRRASLQQIVTRCCSKTEAS